MGLFLTRARFDKGEVPLQLGIVLTGNAVVFF